MRFVDAWMIRRRTPAERLVLAWDRLTPVLDGLVAAHVPADRVAEVLADLVQVGMAVDELRPAAVAAEAEVGECELCGQELIRTAGDCWHPHTVPVGCPPQVVDRGIPRPAFGDWHRPGRAHWRPGPTVGEG